MIRLILWTMLLLIASACGTSGAVQQTLEANENTAQARLDSLYLTGTVQAERLNLTLEFVETRSARIAGQQRDIISTLDSRGVDVSILPQAATPIPTQPPSADGTSVVVPIVTPGILITPQNAPGALPTSASEFIRDLVTSTGVGDDDCATGVTSQFSSTSENIYVVGVAAGVPEGTVMNTRWLNASGEELANYSHTFDAIPEEACVWFYVDQTDFPFTAGTYSVIFTVADVPAGTLPFRIGE